MKRHSAEHSAFVHDSILHAAADHRGQDAGEYMMRGEGLRVMNLSGAGGFKLGRLIRHIGRTVKHSKRAVHEARPAFKSAQDVAREIAQLAQ